MLVAIICEYNPFHYGHLYQITQIKKAYPDAKILAIMSGNLVQRGEFSILEKKEKTKISLNNGVDLVIELPVIFCLQAAENFAYYGVKIAKALGASAISFGIESEIDDLKNFVDLLFKYEDDLKIFIRENKSYSHNEAIIKYFTEKGLIQDDHIFKSNNILAIEYLKAMTKLAYKPEIIGVRRKKSAYNSKALDDLSFSASAIRANLDRMDLLSNKIPPDSFEALKNHMPLSYGERIYDILKYKLLVEKAPMDDITGYEKGIENIFIKNLRLSFDDFIRNISSRKYRPNRLKRLILNYILDIKKNQVDYFISQDIKAVRVLGFNLNNFDFNLIDKKIKLVSQHSHLKKLSDDYKLLFEKNIEADILYENSNKISDYKDFPIIKKF